MSLYDIKKIDNDISAKEQIPFSLSEGKTVLAYGIIGAGEGRIADCVGIYRFRENSYSHVTGWVWIRGHSDPKQNGYFHYAVSDISLVFTYPGMVAFLAEVDGGLVDEKVDKKVLQAVIDFVLPSQKTKKKLN